ncbi:MAG TPA: hypothetical protein VK513_02320, partial [Terriglobales bacterium]|nr:hypothetical protein [Terriglobales bacterium]
AGFIVSPLTQLLNAIPVFKLRHKIIIAARTASAPDGKFHFDAQRSKQTDEPDLSPVGRARHSGALPVSPFPFRR